MALETKLVGARGELRDARLYARRIEIAAASFGRQLQGLAIILECDFLLAQMFQAYGEVVSVIGIARIQTVRLKIRLLRLRPLVLLRIQIAEIELQRRGGIACQQLLQARFRRLRIGAAHQRHQTGLRQRVTRLDIEDGHEMSLCVLGAIVVLRDGGQAQQRIDVARLTAHHLTV